MQLDLKSLIVGVILGLALALTIAATVDQNTSQEIGRYQVAAHANQPFYVVLDTRTGDVYSPSYPGDPQQLYRARFIRKE